MDKHTIESNALVFGLFLLWALIIAIMHWNGHAVVLDGDTSLASARFGTAPPE